MISKIPSVNDQMPEVDRVFQSWACVDNFQMPNVETEQNFVNLDVYISGEVAELYGSFTGALDALLWGDMPETYLKVLAEIVAITMKQDNNLPGTGLDIPLEWYPDRYTKPFKDIMFVKNQRRLNIFDQMEDLRIKRSDILEYQVCSFRILASLTNDICRDTIRSHFSTRRYPISTRRLIHKLHKLPLKMETTL